MNLNKLTEKARQAIAGAQEIADNHRDTQVEPEHLLYALLTQDEGVVPVSWSAWDGRTQNRAAGRSAHRAITEADGGWPAGVRLARVPPGV